MRKTIVKLKLQWRGPSLDFDDESDDQGDFADASAELPLLGTADQSLENLETAPAIESENIYLTIDNNNEKHLSGSQVSFLETGCDWVEAAVLAQQPKRSGTQRDWVNVDANGETKPYSINWCNIQQ